MQSAPNGECVLCCRQACSSQLRGSPPSNVEVTHINLNDGTVESMRHREAPVHSVQYHPEAAPGPHDAKYFFAEFARMIETWPGWRGRHRWRTNPCGITWG